MIEWTETAQRTVEEYCARSRMVLAGSGADAEEVSDDLRRHVEEEVRAARLSVVTEEDVRRILARVGEPGTPVEEPRCQATPKPGPPVLQTEDKKRPGILLLVLGVILPLGTLIFELVTGMWLHQPQPVLLASESGLRQRIERTTTPVRLFELQTRNGPDRIILESAVELQPDEVGGGCASHSRGSSVV